MLPFDFILLLLSILLILSIFLTKFSDNFGLPALLLFLAIGMLAGSDGIGKIDFTDYNLTQSVGTLALLLILFSGGLDTSLKEVKPVIWHAISLATLGVVITAVIVGLLCHYILGFDFMYSLLLGAIVSSTDAAAVFSILRSKNINLKSNLKPLLELESGCNDPIAIFLTLTVITMILTNEINIVLVLFDLVKEFSLGFLLAYSFSKIMIMIFNRIKLTYDGLYPVMALAYAIFIYSLTMFLGGSGFLAVYVAGIMIGNSHIIQKKSTMRFFDGLAWLGQIGMFLTMGLLVFPSQLISIAVTGLILSAILIFVARPVSVFISLMFTKYSVREKLTVSWIGLRGAVPIILATFPLTAGINNSDLIFNLVFFIVLTSALLQGWSIPFVTRLFGVYSRPELRIKSPLDFEPSNNANSQLFEYVVPYNSPLIGKSLVELGLPHDSLVVFVCREEKFFVPNGSTIISEEDVFQILITDSNKKIVMEKLRNN